MAQVDTANNGQATIETLDDVPVSEPKLEQPKDNHLYLFQFKLGEDFKAALLIAPTMQEARKLADKELAEKFPDVAEENKQVHSGTMITDSTVAAIAREVLRNKVRIGWFDEQSGQSWAMI